MSAPVIDKNKLLYENKNNIIKKTITTTNPSQNSRQTLATSIIRYDDEKRQKEKEENQKIKLNSQSPSEQIFSAQSASNLLECKTCGKTITNVVCNYLKNE